MCYNRATNTILWIQTEA